MAVDREQVQAWAAAERRPQKQVDELVRYGEGAVCFAEFSAWLARQAPKQTKRTKTVDEDQDA